MDESKLAFPMSEEWGYHRGMTMRQHYAGLALSGLLPALDANHPRPHDQVADVCKKAWEFADELLLQETQ